nr:hypothetical protein [Tanacetum cinerariifolium]
MKRKYLTVELLWHDLKVQPTYALGHEKVKLPRPPQEEFHDTLYQEHVQPTYALGHEKVKLPRPPQEEFHDTLYQEHRETLLSKGKP